MSLDSNPLDKVPARGLSIRAPWWWAILWMGKDIENRNWRRNFRGTVLLHASKWWNTDEAMDDVECATAMMRQAGYRPPDSAFPHDAEGAPVRLLKTDMLKPAGGCIVGMVDIVGCVDRSDSPWFVGKYGFQLANPVALPTPIPCKGALGFFPVPMDVRAQVLEQMESGHGRNTEAGTSLPTGVTCGDCRHIKRCEAMFGHEPTDNYCDWTPSRFAPATEVAG